LESDIAVSLGISGVHVVGHIPGTHSVGIEVPNERPDIVSMRSVLATEKFRDTVMDLPIALGKSMTNEVVILDLAELSHLLIVGGYGHGKSVALNALIVSLLYKKHPSQLKFVLIDISRGEFIMYNKIERHFLAKLPNESEAVVTKSSKVFETLNSLSVEIDRRYNLLNNGQVRNVKDYNEKFIALKLNPNNGHRFLPFIVVVIDEFANLISTMDKEIELLIARIAQQGRAVGIHLVISVQGISVNILTGTMKANFTSRVAFKVSSINDSKTILDIGGAEKLTGNGDMLFLDGPNLVHLQGAFVSPAEVERVTEFIGFQRGYPEAYRLLGNAF
jgi:S-DNA-T family DNA segregation ATPase FtsK/SpoIIIE